MSAATLVYSFSLEDAELPLNVLKGRKSIYVGFVLNVNLLFYALHFKVCFKYHNQAQNVLVCRNKF